MARNKFGHIEQMRSGRWQAHYVHPYIKIRPDGKRNRIYAPYTFKTKTAARNWLTQIEAAINNGTWKSPDDERREREEAERQARIDAYSVRDFQAQFLASREWGTETRRKETQRLDDYILPRWGDVPLKQVTANDVDKWINVEFDRTIPGVRKKCFELFRTLLREAHRRGLIDVVATDRVKVQDINGDKIKDSERRQAKRVPRALTAHEEVKLLAHLSPRYRLLARFLIASGIRLGEARYLKGSHVTKDADGNVWIHVAGTYSGAGKNAYENKGGKTKNAVRDIPVLGDLGREIYAQAQAQRQGYLFPAVADITLPVSDVSFRKRLESAAKEAEIKHVAPHDFRHTAASNMVTAGIEEATILNIMGHGSSQILKRYTHIPNRHKLEAIRKLSQPGNVSSLDVKRQQKQERKLNRV
ncbi:tyrosine-type recombinase/integrase [Arcanobacterium canis]